MAIVATINGTFTESYLFYFNNFIIILYFFTHS